MSEANGISKSYRKKIVLVGSGQIGSTLALLAGLKNIGDVILLDLVEGMPMGKSLDLNHLGTIEGMSCQFSGSNNFEEMKDADVVIVTAGIARKPGMSRDDLLNINSNIIRQVGLHVKSYCPNSFVVCITNPLDAMVNLLRESSGLSSHMVCGMAGTLDAARFKYFLSEKLNVSADDINVLAMGGHGDSMLLLTRYCSVSGIPLSEIIKLGWISQKEIDDIVERTRNSGGEIVQLLKMGSAYYAPASATIAMVESYLMDKKRLLPCSAYLAGEYGVKGIYVGVPCIIGRGGIEKIVELQLTDVEAKAFKKSVEYVEGLLAATPKSDA